MSAFTFDSNQRITSSTGAIANVVAGLPFAAGGELVVTNGTLSPNGFQNGWPLESTGKIAIHVGGTVSVVQNGLPLTSAGRIATDSSTAVDGFSNGLPFAGGKLSVA